MNRGDTDGCSGGGKLSQESSRRLQTGVKRSPLVYSRDSMCMR